jgi:hypothetical protein
MVKTCLLFMFGLVSNGSFATDTTIFEWWLLWLEFINALALEVIFGRDVSNK